MGGMGNMGGMGGNPLGQMGLDLSLNKIPLIGTFFQDPAEQFKQQQFSQAGRAYGAYRPEVAQARMNARRNADTAFQGANDLMAAFSGGKSHGIDASQAYQNPMGPTMMTQGQSNPGQPMGMGEAAQAGGLGGMLPGMGGLGGK